MTVEQCHANLSTIRRKQGTRYPLIRVHCAGTSYRGRLSRSDSDPEYRKHPSSPFGILVLESLGLTRGPETIVQIASIVDDGICELDDA